MEECRSSLPHEDTIIFVVSTTGQGDTPDSMKVFWKSLLQRNLSKHWLEGVRYAVFGLGDSGYQKYNFVAKKLDKRLSDLGAMAIVEKGLGDDQHPSGYEAALDPWMSSLWSMLNQINHKFFPQGPDFMIPDMELIGQPKVQITYHGIDKMDSQISPNSVVGSHPETSPCESEVVGSSLGVGPSGEGLGLEDMLPSRSKVQHLLGASNSLGPHPLMKSQGFTLIRVAKLPRVQCMDPVGLVEVHVSWPGHPKL
uniref:Flavodoxin-like domain-containing protein n=1 Tax=Fagus sylvatica TaxID=28930 RepID=A0A2N9GQK3_FAGSY